MTVVPLEQVWVEANFAKPSYAMRPPAGRISPIAYGDDVTRPARSQAPGTERVRAAGAECKRQLIKIVQRVPKK
jgi:hypothetical protein